MKKIIYGIIAGIIVISTSIVVWYNLRNVSVGATLPTVIALYEDTLAQKINNTSTSTFTLVRGTDKQDRNIDGYFGFVIDEGTSVEEFFLATCLATACTIDTRGIDVIDGKTDVLENQYEHRRGAVVKMTNYPQLAVLTRIVNGDESLDNFMYVSSSTNLPFLDAQLATKYYVDTVGAGGFTAANVSTTQGIQVFGTSPETVGANVSSTLGLAIDSTGHIYQIVSSTKGIATNSNGLYIDETQARNWTGYHTFTTAYSASSSIDNLIATTLYIGGTSTAPLVNGDVTTLHKHDDSACKVGFGYRPINTGSGTQVVTTSIDANYISFYAGRGTYTTTGFYDAVTATKGSYTTNASEFYATSSVDVMLFYDVGGSAVVDVVMTATSTTGFTLTWDATPNSGGGNYNYMWKACK